MPNFPVFGANGTGLSMPNFPNLGVTNTSSQQNHSEDTKKKEVDTKKEKIKVSTMRDYVKMLRKTQALNSEGTTTLSAIGKAMEISRSSLRNLLCVAREIEFRDDVHNDNTSINMLYSTFVQNNENGLGSSVVALFVKHKEGISAYQVDLSKILSVQYGRKDGLS